MESVDQRKFHVLAADDSIVDSGTKALRVVEEVEVNLIITDYTMPGMTGYDLLREIKGCSALRHIPVVVDWWCRPRTSRRGFAAACRRAPRSSASNPFGWPTSNRIP
ncbi:unnamed protein product [Cuscuta campestris]|uniref:Response regulatory domain-containing protein n=1 Tax=Cuscuta campestris TaxID=132261 RepID=A0A484LUH4_9ASTE|nr:unnamed protein product [Cuscuta campestris]